MDGPFSVMAANLVADDGKGVWTLIKEAQESLDAAYLDFSELAMAAVDGLVQQAAVQHAEKNMKRVALMAAWETAAVRSDMRRVLSGIPVELRTKARRCGSVKPRREERTTCR